jgi:hypothetical protein
VNCIITASIATSTIFRIGMTKLDMVAERMNAECFMTFLRLAKIKEKPKTIEWSN